MVFLISFSSNVFAGGSSQGGVTSISANMGGMLFFSAGTINTSTTCHTLGKGWVLDISKPVGRSLQALIM